MLANLTQFKSYIGGLKTNMKGGKVKRKIVILESDDWGAIRTPSRESLQAFEKNGFDIAGSLYKNDALESSEDLELLFELLQSVKGADGKPAKFTANAIMANPDFERIKGSGYSEYFYEPFFKTFERYPQHSGNLELWKKGKSEALFIPQFHGREHLNVKRWMKALQQKDDKLHLAFEWGATFSGKDDYSFMEAYDWDHPVEIEDHNEIIKDGLEMFEKHLGYQSASFIAPCYNWDSKLEPMLHQKGIKWIQGLPNQLAPTGSFGQYKAIPHAFASKNNLGQYYNVRNCIFEPSTNPDLDWVDKVMGRMLAAFQLDKPAVICTHRVNFIGYIDPQNRSNGLYQLEKLLKKITRQWPDAIFVSTDELDKYLV